PSFTGESGGEPRYMNSPDINTEDFGAAVDFLATHELVNPNAIGILGICGWGGMAINAAAIDTRIKATVASTMYDMSRVTANNYNDALDTAEARQTLRMQMSEQRTIDYKNGTPERAGGVPESLPDQAPQFMKDYHTYYKTPRGYHKRSLNSNEGWNKTAAISLLNTKLLAYANEIVNPVLIIHGADAHSRYFSEGAFEKMTGKHVENENATVGNKELMIIPDANHIDLYDNMEKIPFDKIESFYKENLK
ncbi:MAG: alpha/beta hydrolase, partial [Proteobacteria bacterium]|nr:alpha/beta hydrolase [Pseudomonadota bacterium]